MKQEKTNVLNESKIIENNNIIEEEKSTIIEDFKKAETEIELNQRDIKFVNENLLNLLNINPKNEKNILIMIKLLNEKKANSEKIERLKILKERKERNIERIRRTLASIKENKDKLITDYTDELKEIVEDIRKTIENTHSTIIKNNKDLSIHVEKALKPRFSIASFFKLKFTKEESNEIKKSIEEWLETKRDEINKFVELVSKVKEDFSEFKEKVKTFKMPKIDYKIYDSLKEDRNENIIDKSKLNIDVSRIDIEIAEYSKRNEKINLEMKKLKDKYLMHEKEKWINELKSATRKI
ncbi:MAG: hypothetical protein HPAVJP_3260 [Candidatus Hepatoplasma vulgare]|nr:MAG: hypothetical protein HPAVJP_3260 [Candidatus Hepatoplasma sp.]